MVRGSLKPCLGLCVLNGICLCLCLGCRPVDVFLLQKFEAKFKRLFTDIVKSLCCVLRIIFRTSELKHSKQVAFALVV